MQLLKIFNNVDKKQLHFIDTFGIMRKVFINELDETYQGNTSNRANPLRNFSKVSSERNDLKDSDTLKMFEADSKLDEKLSEFSESQEDLIKNLMKSYSGNSFNVSYVDIDIFYQWLSRKYFEFRKMNFDDNEKEIGVGTDSNDFSFLEGFDDSESESNEPEFSVLSQLFLALVSDIGNLSDLLNFENDSENSGGGLT